jgi:hypothetical protein
MHLGAPVECLDRLVRQLRRVQADRDPPNHFIQAAVDGVDFGAAFSVHYVTFIPA